MTPGAFPFRAREDPPSKTLRKPLALATAVAWLFSKVLGSSNVGTWSVSCMMNRQHPCKTFRLDLTPRRGVLVLAIILLIAAASIGGLQLTALVPAGLQKGFIVSLGAVALALLGLKARQGQRALTVGLALMLGVLAFLLYWFGLLRIAEFMHVAMFGALGMALAPARPLSALAIVAVVSIGDEALQALLPYRVGSLADVGLNFASGSLLYTGWRHFGRRG